MFLTEGERRELYKSLHLMKEGDVPMSAMPRDLSTSSSPPGIPAFGSFQPPAFAPHPGYGQPTMPVAPSTMPVAPPTMPSTLPVLRATHGGGK